MQALGGTEAWNKTRYLRFDFAVDRGGKNVMRRSHTWDKWTGRYRLEATTREGEAYLVLLNIGSKDGRAWLKGTELQGDEARKYLEQAYAAWVNDTYWLLMPYKMKDPGVALALDGEETKGGETWDKLRLTFDNVGLDAEGQVLGLRQPQDRPGGPLGLRAEGREQAAHHVHVAELEEVRQRDARRRPPEPRGRHAHLLPGAGSAGLAPGRLVHCALSEPLSDSPKSIQNVSMR